MGSLQFTTFMNGFKILFIVIGLQLCSFVCINAASIPSKTPLAIRIQQCREGCLEKFSTEETLCPNRPECATCWEECAKPAPSKLTKTIQETWTLRTVSMLQQDSLVLVDVAWDPQLNTPNQCLVTWEVSGGGLMGNLLTETYSVQLSLWPDTKYRVQVTCKNKITGSMSRSLPLNIDTSKAITTHIPVKSTNKPIAQSTLKQHLKMISTTQTSLMANLPFATSSSSPSIPISAPIPTFMDHPLSSFENDDEIDSVPDDDQQSNELSSIRHEQNHKHTNYVFDWHHGQQPINTDHMPADVQVDKLIPINQSDLNIFSIESISDIQKPLFCGIIAGILLLSCILAMYIFALRRQRVPSDKVALMDEDNSSCCNSLDNHDINVCKNNCGNDHGCNNTSTDVGTTCGATNHFGTGPSNILNPNFYSKSVHVLTV